MNFRILTVRTGAATTIAVEGELDLATAAALTAAVRDVNADAAAVVVELSGVTFIDSTGVHALLDARERLGSRLRVVASVPCRRVIEVAGVGDLLPLVVEGDAP